MNNDELLNKLRLEARYLHIAIPYDKDDEYGLIEPDFSDFLKDGKEPKPVKTNKWQRAEEAYYDVMRHNLNQQEMIWLVQRLLTKSEISMKQLSNEVMC